MQGTRVSPEPELIRTEEIEKIVAGVTHDGIDRLRHGVQGSSFSDLIDALFRIFSRVLSAGLFAIRGFFHFAPPPPRPFDVNLVPINSAHLPSPYGSARNESPRWIRAL